jgi:hypothetical protein
MKGQAVRILIVAALIAITACGAAADKVTIINNYYGGAPFVYSGVTYVPLRDVADVIGAALLLDTLHNRATIIYNGRHFALVIGSPRVFYGTEVILLPAAPVIIGGQIFVPQRFFDRDLHVRVQRDRDRFRVWGPKGEREWRVASRPPKGFFWGRRSKPTSIGAFRPQRQRGHEARARERFQPIYAPPGHVKKQKSFERRPKHQGRNAPAAFEKRRGGAPSGHYKRGGGKLPRGQAKKAGRDKGKGHDKGGDQGQGRGRGRGGD